ncbi:MAG TPA: response regulator [Thermoanaerobaculia bacterium]|jgi:FixJ family two-component response regulator|nr:response regulator [Thermoanaerobaculia bacterium]
MSREIVVVEDDPGMRDALRKLLAAAGLHAAAFASPEELLASGAAADAGCLIFDVRLPQASGPELYRRLKRMGIHPPVIFMTAFDDPAPRADAERLGAAGYLVKPFGGRELVDAVVAALGGSCRPATESGAIK